MKRARILWADDEIDLLKPYVLFLNERGFDVVEVNNGRDAIDLCSEQMFDLIFLDEHMPGISGLETLEKINRLHPHIPIVMITKSEDEGIMEKAIGKKIADYLIKPVNPHQILLAIKKILDKRDIEKESSLVGYRDDFVVLANDINTCNTPQGWVSIYKRLVSWDITFEASGNPMEDVLLMQKKEANSEFSKFIRSQYQSWFSTKAGDDAPILSHTLFKERIFPVLDKNERVFLILLDNFRLDQWYSIKPLLIDYFSINEDVYFSILPTATQYARNALLSGQTPLQLSKAYPQLWVDEGDDQGKNLSEDILLKAFIDKFRPGKKVGYRKVNSNAEGERLLLDFNALENNNLNVIVFNFIDILSHARTEQKMLQELVPNEAAYRSLTHAWFQHSPLFTLLKRISEKGYKAVFTTDHGTIRVKNPLKIVTDKSASTNPRYKVGRHMTYDNKKVFEVLQPELIGLPSPNLSSRYVFALSDSFFVYQSNYNNYVSFHEDSFQHGGVSMEEMMVPFAVLSSK